MPILNYVETDLRSLPEMGLALRLTIWKWAKRSKNRDKRDKNAGAESKRMFSYLGVLRMQLSFLAVKTDK